MSYQLQKMFREGTVTRLKRSVYCLCQS